MGGKGKQGVRTLVGKGYIWTAWPELSASEIRYRGSCSSSVSGFRVGRLDKITGDVRRKEI